MIDVCGPKPVMILSIKRRSVGSEVVLYHIKVRGYATSKVLDKSLLSKRGSPGRYYSYDGVK